MTEADDSQLLQRWRGGDSAAAEALIERHFPRIKRFFARKISDREQIEELVQRTFARCLKRIDAFEGRSSFYSFLYGIARNILLEYFREIRRDDRSTSMEVEQTPIATLDPSPFTAFEKKQERKLLINVLRRLPLDTQIIIELYYIENLTGPQVSEILGVPESTVRARIRGSNRRLRELAEELAQSPELLQSTMMTIDGWAQGIRSQAGAG